MYDETEEKIVAAYCRVSTERDDQLNSFESQQKYFTRYIESHPKWKLFNVYADRGLSGTTTKNRKAFNRMLIDAEEGLFSMVLTKEISRFARNTLDSIYYTRQLKSMGVGVVFLNDNINTLDPDAELRLSIMASIAQEESRKTSQRVKWGQKRRMEEGVVFGRKLMGYDLRNGELFVNEPEAEIIREIFRKFVLEGKGAGAIAEDLKAAGVPPGGRIQEWTNTAILRILKNEKYCGDLIQKKTYTPDYLSHEKKYNRGQEEKVVIKNHHQEIVSRDVFNSARELLEERRKVGAHENKCSTRYLLSGKIKCGCCGANYVARVKKRKDGSLYFGWRCFEGTKNGKKHMDEGGKCIGCNGPTISNENIVSMLPAAMSRLLIDRKDVGLQLVRLIEWSVLNSAPDSAREGTIDDRKERLVRLYIEGEISQEEYHLWAEKMKKDAPGLDAESLFGVDSTSGDWELRKDLVTERVFALLDGIPEEDIFYRKILDKVVVLEDGGVEVYFFGLETPVCFCRNRGSRGE